MSEHRTLQLAAAVLQSDATSLDDKIDALRKVKVYTETHKDSIDPYLQRGISQLIIDNVLKIILREDKTVNPLQKQLVRVELYSILSHFLESHALFGSDVVKNIHNFSLPREESDHSDRDDASSKASSRRSTATPQERSKSTPWRPSSKQQPLLQPQRSTDDLDGAASPKEFNSRRSFILHRQHKLSALSVSLEEPAVTSRPMTVSKSQPLLVAEFMKEKSKQGRVHIKKFWRPRPAVLFSDRLETETIVPGADPTNFLEQDRRLGYQKPRMWFPTRKLGLAPANKILQASSSGADQVVDQYLNMQSLASYVGDLVVPYSSVGRSRLNRLEMISTSRHLSPAMATKLSATSAVSRVLVDPRRFPAALQEAMAMWAPVLKSHIPKAGGRKRFQQLTDAASASAADKVAPQVVVREFEEEDVGLSERDDPNSLRNLRKQGLAVDTLARTYQRAVTSRLDSRRQQLADSIAALHSRIHASIAAHYSTFHPKYLLLVEGRHAKARKLIRNMIRLFTRARRRSQLQLGFGMLKIGVVRAQSLERRPAYAKMASCSLVARWVQRQRQRNFRHWLHKWRDNVSWMIFLERHAGSATIQTLYRRWRDRRKFVLMHKIAPYNGIISDIALAPHRQRVKRTIPRVIRDEKRLYWIAATMIQALYRCWIESRDFFNKKRRIVLLQAICRMWPKYRWFQRLKATTVRCQALMRRTVKQRQYRRLKRATIVVQKYVRRFQAIMLKLALLDRSVWRPLEEQLWAAIKIQCRYRIRLSRRKTKKRRIGVLMKDYGALVIQRNWYRYKGAFHTFFLMCALRERERQDVALEKLASRMGRAYKARLIQRLYKERYRKRIISNVVLVQCWFRGRLGYNLVDLLRKERWASRKLRHWVHTKLRFRHRTARKLQRWWWRLKKLRLLRHLWHKHRERDREEQHSTAERKHHAAARIQAHVLGIWARRYVRRLRAALIIQKNWRFLNGLRKWKAMKRTRIQKAVKAVVDRMVERAVLRRVADLVALHSQMLVKPQALARGFIVRAVMAKARFFATKLGLAAVRIQRFWRQSGAMTQAVEEVLAKKRMQGNPFKACRSLHEVLRVLRDQTKALYSYTDPRVGMKMTTVLYRMGLSELEVYFPRRGFEFAEDGAHLSVDRLVEWYEAYHARLREKERKEKEKQGGSAPPKRTKPPPTQAFSALVAVLRVPYFSKSAKDRERLHFALTVLPDHLSPWGAVQAIRKLFLKKFGRNLQTRATNFAREVLESTFVPFSNHHNFGMRVVTVGQISRAIQLPQDSTLVMKSLDELRKVHAYSAEDRKWDLDRLRTASNALQLAYDKAIALLPACAVRTMLERAVARIASYRRKSAFLLQKSQRAAALKARQRGASGGAAVKTPAKDATSSHAPAPLAAQAASTATGAPSGLSEAEAEMFITPLIPLPRMDHHLTPSETLDLAFHGADEDFELDYLASICKMFMCLAERLMMASMGIQSLKNAWNNKAVRRALVHERRRIFLANATQNYIAEQQHDRVRAVWAKFQRRERNQRRYEAIVLAAQTRRAAVEAALAYVPRYHVWTQYDQNGYQYFVDEHGLASYEMPTYSYRQAQAAMRIQRHARLYIEGARARRLVKEAEERRAIELAERLLLEERQKALRGVEVAVEFVQERCTVRKDKAVYSLRQAPALVQKHYHALKKGFQAHKLVASEEDLEGELPWRLRFDRECPVRPGVWCLLFTSAQNVGHHSLNAQFQHVPSLWMSTGPGQVDGYDVVVMFRLRAEQGLSDVRTIKGKILRSVPMKRLLHMNYDTHSAVEARYRYRKLFYRGRVQHSEVDPRTLLRTYTVQYEDGEVETGLARDALRPTAQCVLAFFQARAELLQQARLALRRTAHFANLRASRRVEVAQRDVERLLLGGAPIELLKTSGGRQNARDVGEDDEGHGLVAASVAETGASAGNEPAESDDDSDDAPGPGPAESGEADTEAEAETETEVEPFHPENQSALVVAESQATGSSAVPAAAAAVKGLGGARGKRPPMRSARPVAAAGVKPCEPAKIAKVDVRSAVAGSFKVRIRITRQPLCHSWALVPVPLAPPLDAESSPTTALIPYEPRFVNELTGEERTLHDELPMYSAREIHLVCKIQQRWLAFQALRRVKTRCAQRPLPTLIQTCIDQASGLAFVGYKMEGTTTSQLLCRSGHADLAQCIEDFLHATKRPTNSVTLDQLLSLHKDEYEKVGVVQTHHVRDLKDLQTAYKKLTPADREKRLALMNYFSDPYDQRTIQECIQDSGELLMKKFARVAKTGQTRTRQAVQTVQDQSMFPHAHLQLETYLRKYSDKPELLRDCVAELINKPTTHTFREEEKVWRRYHHCALQVAKTLHALRLRRLRTEVMHVVRRAEEMVGDNHLYGSVSKKLLVQKAAERKACTGPEAKAAWMLRRDVFDYLLRVCNAASLLQRHVRRYLLRKRFLAYMTNRILAVDKLQRNVRRWVAWRRAMRLRLQQQSPWEQLWDSRFNRLYYFNVDTQESQYEEPEGGVFRPLIRDKLSSALVQAWPELRPLHPAASLPALALTMGAADQAMPNLLCNVCELRKCVKFCLDCQHELATGVGDTAVSKPVSYCLPCFVLEHPETDTVKSRHRARLFDDPHAAALVVERPVLQCCMCAEPATRKCLGPLDDEQINAICKQLQRTHVQQWARVLQENNVAAERRIVALMEEVMAEAEEDFVPGAASSLTPVQLNSVRAALERMRADCDECYCSSCYHQVHAGGKRAHHRWMSFKPRCRVCSVCTSSPAEEACMDCGSDYCESCSKVFHSMGKKRKHKRDVIYEELDHEEAFCFICSRKAATRCAFDKCNKMGCESCLEFRHQPKCAFNPDNGQAGRRIASSLDGVREVEPKCVVCGETADKRCVQCGDLYCSMVYMGNPGCFAKFHSKGNRAAHTTQTLTDEKLGQARMSMKEKIAQDKRFKHKIGY